MKSLLFTAILSLRKHSEQILIKFAILLQVMLTHAQTFFRGVPFTIHDFKRFAEYLGFQHRRITPCRLKANGEVELFIRTVGKFIRSTNVQARSCKQDLSKFLCKYRAAPHSTSGISPYEALNQRKLKTRHYLKQTCKPYLVIYITNKKKRYRTKVQDEIVY